MRATQPCDSQEKQQNAYRDDAESFPLAVLSTTKSDEDHGFNDIYCWRCLCPVALYTVLKFFFNNDELSIFTIFYVKLLFSFEICSSNGRTGRGRLHLPTMDVDLFGSWGCVIPG